jgi:hypothetical protein
MKGGPISVTSQLRVCEAKLHWFRWRLCAETPDVVVGSMRVPSAPMRSVEPLSWVSKSKR